VLLSLIGLAVASAPWWAYSDPSGTRTTGLILLGLAVLTVPLCTYALRLHHPRNRVTPCDGVRPGLEVWLSNHLLLAVTTLSLVWTVFLLWGALTAGLTGAGLLVLLLALPFAALLPDTLRALLRRPRLALTPEGVTYVGWSSDASVSWPDIAGVDLAAPQVRRPVLRIAVRPGARTFISRRHRLLVSLDVAAEAAIDVPLLALASPGRLTALLDQLVTVDEAGRTALLGPEGLRFLDDRSPPIPGAPLA